MRDIGYYESPLGLIKYTYKNKCIYSLAFHFDDTDKNSGNDKEINAALDQYFAGKLSDFPFDFNYDHLTIFQKKVIEALIKIPYGTTKSYSEVATLIGYPKSMRAVGQACKNNPIAVMIPCHRVIGKNGELTGYSGIKYVSLKEKLLLLEKKYK